MLFGIVLCSGLIAASLIPVPTGRGHDGLVIAAMSACLAVNVGETSGFFVKAFSDFTMGPFCNVIALVILSMGSSFALRMWAEKNVDCDLGIILAQQGESLVVQFIFYAFAGCLPADWIPWLGTMLPLPICLLLLNRAEGSDIARVGHASSIDAFPAPSAMRQFILPISVTILLCSFGNALLASTAAVAGDSRLWTAGTLLVGVMILVSVGGLSS
jgi:hypothetical protein